MSHEPLNHNKRDPQGRRLVSPWIADYDHSQVRTARKNKETVFSDYFIGWRNLWSEAQRIKEMFGRHPSVRELLEFYLAESPDIPEDVIEIRFNRTLKTIEQKGLVTRAMGSVDGRVCQVLVNIQNPSITKVEEEAEDGSQNKEDKKIDLDSV